MLLMTRDAWRALLLMGICAGRFKRSDPGSLASLRSDELMTRNPTVASPELLAYDALRLMEDRPRRFRSCRLSMVIEFAWA